MKTRSSGRGPTGRALAAIVLEELNKRLLLCRLETGSNYYKNITLNLRDNTIRTPNAVIYDVPIPARINSTLKYLLLLNSKTPH